MSNLTRTFETATDSETLGVWNEYGDMSFRVARAGGANTAFLKAMAKIDKKYGLAMKHKQISPDRQKELMVPVIAQTLLTDWKGVTDDDGNEIPFSTEAAEKELREAPDFADLVFRWATDDAMYRKQTLEDASKN